MGAEPAFPKAQADPGGKALESEAAQDHVGSRCLSTASTAQVAAACPQVVYRLPLQLNWGRLQGVLCHGQSKVHSTVAIGVGVLFILSSDAGHVMWPQHWSNV